MIDMANPQVQLSGECITPGGPHDQSAFLSEAAGLYTVCKMVSLLCKYYKVTHGAVTIRCDGAKALHCVFASDFLPSPRDAHFDLLIATRRVIAEMAIHWSSKWVQGHQDV